MTRHPTAEWLAQQILEAFPWETAPTYLVRDNDGAYGPAYRRRVRAMGIRDRPISPRSPWQNPYAERLIGTLRRDCLDQLSPAPKPVTQSKRLTVPAPIELTRTRVAVENRRVPVRSGPAKATHRVSE